MKKYLITIKESKKDNNAGPKAKVDIEAFLTSSGFQKMNFYINQRSYIEKIKTAYLEIPKAISKLDRNSEVVLQYPTYSEIITKSLIKAIEKKKSIKLIIIIHDVESLRLHFNEKGYIEKEMNLFNTASGLVVHNASMKKWLSKQGVNVPMEILGIFDYDNKTKLSVQKNYDFSVCYAGNLSKSLFLKNIHLQKITLNVYGPNPLNYRGNVKYKGQYSPDELPKYLHESFGLVWDGRSTNTCDGLYGNYMRFNNPHKVSLYLSSGIPVIIWKQAALADFIEKNKIGIAVESLNELDDILSKLSFEDYCEFVRNAEKISNKLRAGFYIKKAIKNIEKKTEKENS